MCSSTDLDQFTHMANNNQQQTTVSMNGKHRGCSFSVEDFLHTSISAKIR